MVNVKVTSFIPMFFNYYKIAAFFDLTLIYFTLKYTIILHIDLLKITIAVYDHEEVLSLINAYFKETVSHSVHHFFAWQISSRNSSKLL